MKIECKHEDRCISYRYRCEHCKRNKNAVLKDYFNDRGYIPSCVHGYTNCICDPAYLIYCSEKGYHRKLSESRLKKLQEEIKQGCNCGEDAPDYDDEDK